nr:MAG: hypothetical protein E4H34_04175 [Hyphomicrobiales bacterium]
MARQLPLPLELRPTRSREAFIVAPSNEAAVRFIDSWPEWPERRGALFGPRGSGKSHLVEVWRAASRALRVSAEDISPAWIMSVPDDAAVAIEDVDAFAGSANMERDMALLALFERPQGTLLFRELQRRRIGRRLPATYAPASMRCWLLRWNLPMMRF